MDAKQLRDWSDRWVYKFRRDTEKFYKAVEKLDIEKMSIEELAKALEIDKHKADYMKRGHRRYGRTIKSSGSRKGGTKIQRIIAMETELQKLLAREVKLEAELKEVRKKIEAYQPIRRDLENLMKSVEKVEDTAKKTSS